MAGSPLAPCREPPCPGASGGPGSSRGTRGGSWTMAARAARDGAVNCSERFTVEKPLRSPRAARQKFVLPALPLSVVPPGRDSAQPAERRQFPSARSPAPLPVRSERCWKPGCSCGARVPPGFAGSSGGRRGAAAAAVPAVHMPRGERAQRLRAPERPGTGRPCPRLGLQLLLLLPGTMRAGH